MRIKRLSDIKAKAPKVYESMEDSYTYTTRLSSDPKKGNESYAELVSVPKSIKKGFITISGGQMIWELDLRDTRYGLDLGSNKATIKSIRIELEIEDEETDEIEDMTIEIDGSLINFEKVDVKIGKLPLFLTSLVIDMENTDDKSKWRYSLEIGDI